MRIVMGDSAMLDWVASRIDGFESFGPGPVPLGIVSEDNTLLGCLVYHNYRRPSIEETFAADAPRCLTPRIVAQLLAIPFEAWGCKRITSLIEADNKRSQRLTAGLGFVHEGTIREGGDKGNLEIYGLTKTDFYSGKYGRLWKSGAMNYGKESPQSPRPVNSDKGSDGSEPTEPVHTGR